MSGTEPFVCAYRHRSGPQEVQVCVFPKQVTLRVGGIKLLPTHDEMAGKVTACEEKRVRNKQRSFALVPQKQKRNWGGEKVENIYSPIKCPPDIMVQAGPALNDGKQLDFRLTDTRGSRTWFVLEF